MYNKITPIKPSLFKRIMRFLFYRQFIYLMLMHKFNCSRKQAKHLYKIWSEMKS